MIRPLVTDSWQLDSACLDSTVHECAAVVVVQTVWSTIGIVVLPKAFLCVVVHLLRLLVIGLEVCALDFPTLPCLVGD